MKTLIHLITFPARVAWDALYLAGRVRANEEAMK